ncbi:MAG TPA: uracil-DNA glycosylase [Candidatus Saccharimonadales bacterium]|nr:uracil-DNA glycosylase [Candidatus Saccharimonadales bacterium]
MPTSVDASTKQTRLDQIAAEIVTHNVCPDLAKMATHLVPGEGSPNAKVVFIGEAPGKNEDLSGRPFVGAAGKFLDELLASIGLTREDVFITSILKYRPPNNRDPKPEEKAAFWPYLLAQLEVIEPALIVTLGRHSLNCFLPDLQISTVHGQLLHWNKYQLLALYHPAAALYNGNMRQTLVNDFAQIAKTTEH